MRLVVNLRICLGVLFTFYGGGLESKAEDIKSKYETLSFLDKKEEKLYLSLSGEEKYVYLMPPIRFNGKEWDPLYVCDAIKNNFPKKSELRVSCFC